jgi:hypothetical protein
VNSAPLPKPALLTAIPPPTDESPKFQIPNQGFTFSYLADSNLLASVTQSGSPVIQTTNTWEPNRDVLDIKQNKVGSTVISSYDYAVNAIGQRTGVTTSGTAFPMLPSWA